MITTDLTVSETEPDEAGRRNASETAQAVGGFVAMPVFSEGVNHVRF